VDAADWPSTLAGHRAGDVCDAELAAAYVVTRVGARAGSRLLQGARRPGLRIDGKGPFLETLAATRVRGVSDPVARALVAWALGAAHVHLLFRVPLPIEVLGWQSRGERCVSLVADDVATAPHADGLAFALHDLCHLEKFIDPEHFTGQVGFFRAVHRALTDPRWSSFAGRFDDAFATDLEHVVADMNGSAVFLFAALKMKLKMAVRRRVARAAGREARGSGPLDETESQAYATDLRTLLALLGLEGELAGVADRVSTRRDEEQAALHLLRHFEAAGSVAVAR
jgi:hypothetical protein